MNEDNDLRATPEIQVKNETSEQTTEVKNQSPQIDIKPQEDVKNEPSKVADTAVEQGENSNIDINPNENLNTQNPPPRIDTAVEDVKNIQSAAEVQQGDKGQQNDIAPPKQEEAKAQVEEPRQPAQQNIEQDAPEQAAPRRLTRQELFAKRQEDLIKASGVPIAAIQGTRGTTYITQSEEGKFYALTQGPRGVRRVALDKSFKPEDLWQNPRAVINPNVAFDPNTGRFKAVQQEQQAADQQEARPPAQAGGGAWNPEIRNRDQVNNVPQPRENDRPAAEPNRVSVVKLQPGTRFRFYEETMTLVVE